MKQTATDQINPVSVMKEDEVLTTEEAIKYLKISRPTFFKCIHQGRINAIKVGNGWRVLKSELYRFMKRRRVLPTKMP